MPAPASAAIPDEIASLSYPDLVSRQEYITTRLPEVALSVAAAAPPKKRKVSPQKQTKNSASNGSVVPVVASAEKIDTHWDFLMKEMMWLATDFSSERKRHGSMRRKLCNGLRVSLKSRAARAERELANAEIRRRKLAARLGREVKGWWAKIERVVSYKQKVSADEERRGAMNKQLVALVRQTERYSESLARNDYLESDDDKVTTDAEQGSTNRKQGRKYRRMTIEEALADGKTRRSKSRVTDYARIQLEQDNSSFYGESTASDNSGSDGSYAPEFDRDDETTFLEAQVEETLERQRLRRTASEEEDDLDDDNDDKSFVGDPVELRKLQEESTMEVNDVLERLRKEAASTDSTTETVEMDLSEKDKEESAKKVTFVTTVQVQSPSPALATRSRPRTAKPDPGSDADDDADASDVEDFVDMETDSLDGSEDFVADQDEVDDETTMAQEESLPIVMAVDEEIQMLKDENELSVEELRRKYTAALGVTEYANEPEATDADNPVKSSTEKSLDDMLEVDDAGEEDEFCPAAGADVDDETTFEAEERLGRDMSYEAEISLLENESEIPIEQLRAMYASMNNTASEDEVMDSEEETPDNGGDGEVHGASTLHELATAQTDDMEEEEFEPNDQDAVDDETTMEVEERLCRDMSYGDEIALLKRESEMSFEKLRSLYAGIDEVEELDEFDNEGISQPSSLSVLAGTVEDQENDGDFCPEVDEQDDETTMETEERLGREMSAEAELAMLKEQSEIPVEALRKMHQVNDEDNEEESESEESSLAKRKREAEPAGLNAKRIRHDTEEDDTSDGGKAAFDALEASAERAQKTVASRPYILSPWVKLREYQQIGLNWLVSLQSRRLNGILADEMGLGKTLQTISLLSYLAAYKGIWGPHLIVVPTSVIVNWETELKRFAPALKVLCYYGSAKRRKELRTGWTKSNWYHVVITSYQLAVQDAFAFKRKRWYYLVLDEAHNIKNFQSQRWQTLISFNSQRRLLLTGTPLQNNLMELWSLLHFLMPYIFRSRKEFSYWFSNPMNDMIEGNNQNDEVINRLHGLIRPFVLRRLKKDVETQMPGKYEHIIKCQLSRRQMFIYEEFMARSTTRQAIKKGGNFMGMMNVLMQLRKVCNHPDLFEPRPVVTPFVLDPIDMPMSSCIPFVCGAKSVFDDVSEFLYKPLWCGSRGELSLDATVRHDPIESDCLRNLEASLSADSSDGLAVDEDTGENVPALQNLLKSLREKAEVAKEDNVHFQNRLNSWRCRSDPFAYSSRLISAVTIQRKPLFREDHDVLSTPSQLLSLRRTQRQRADDVEDLVRKFVFCVPKAGTRRRPVLLSNSASSKGDIPEATLEDMLREPLEEILRPFRKANARLSSFFPDKKLVQFDAGKLQTLALLLREKKKGGHRVLIFTQMSKMLDILEAFLNLNGHTYLRLDGSTGVDRRQRLMDRFNNDTKVFCFILSTRSGGLGINLTGADTVVFIDSDWNPAMDAQAQDRAHRIGQTRDVHIYRLVTEHTIEENILKKAQQKRNLDILVMDKGNFDASQLGRGKDDKAASQEDEEVKDIYTKGGLRSILGVEAEAVEASDEEEKAVTDKDMSSEQMESAMTALEDADDVHALRGAQKEVADELREFDESVEFNKEADTEADGNTEVQPQAASAPPMEPKEDEETDALESQKKEEEELEKEFAAWQRKVGMDASAIEASLAPTERYGLRFREEIDPYYSIFAVVEQRHRIEAAEEREDEIDIDEIEQKKAMLERQAIEDGELLATRPAPEDLIRQRNLYMREKSRLRADKKRRKLTGENWVSKVDGVSQLPFWYNSDTGEAVWDRPLVLHQLEEHDVASEKGWSAMPMKALIRVMSYLVPFPDRVKCSQISHHWSRAARDVTFVRHVYPVEMGAYTTDDRKMEYNHYRTLGEAVVAALPGDTIELGDGHYWVNEDLLVDKPLRFVGDEHYPSNVILEMSGTLVWQCKGGWIEGVTFRRPKMSSSEPTSQELLRIENGARLDVTQSVFNNEGSHGSAIRVTESGTKGRWNKVVVKGGDILATAKK